MIEGQVTRVCSFVLLLAAGAHLANSHLLPFSVQVQREAALKEELVDCVATRGQNHLRELKCKNLAFIPILL